MMKKMDKFLKWAGILLGVAALGFFIYDLFFFQELQPRMIAFKPVTKLDENKIIWTGFGLLLFMGCCLVSLLRFVNYLRRSKRIFFVYLVLIIAGVIAMLFVFSYIALLSDIGKQHKYNLPQPEWLILFPIMVFQFVVGLVFILSHFFGFNQKNLLEKVAFDSNIYLVAQYLGLLCGFMGLLAAAMGYIFPRAWTLNVHTTMSLILLFFPYSLIIVYWLLTKLGEKTRVFFDEKQKLDVGRSAFWTLVLDAVIMSCFFVLNYNNLGGVTSINWFPIFLFSSIFIFSLGNLYFSHRET